MTQNMSMYLALPLLWQRLMQFPRSYLFYYQAYRQLFGAIATKTALALIVGLQRAAKSVYAVKKSLPLLYIIYHRLNDRYGSDKRKAAGKYVTLIISTLERSLVADLSKANG